MPSPDNAASVVGGGIAGLAAVASLLRQRWNVTVVERAAETPSSCADEDLQVVEEGELTASILEVFMLGPHRGFA